jgi:glycosyltransferase involved in cell wall biosynthesis
MPIAQSTTRPRPTKVMILITEDWFLLSHFQPLVTALVAAFGDIVVVTTSSGRLAEIEALGARTIALDFERASFDPVRQSRIVRRVLQLIHAERPDVVHAIALKPIALGGLAFAAGRFARPKPKFVMHLTGVGFAGTAAAGRTPLIYAMTLRLMARLLRSGDTALLVENPDDAQRVAGPDWQQRGTITVLGGAGVDPAQFPARPIPAASPPVAGYLGRMVWTKGVDILVEAHRLLGSQSVDLALHLGGTPDAANPRAIPQQQLEEWGRTPGISCLGRISDASAFWANTHIAVVPSRGGEGLPRALLEAAATGRPLIVTDVPGSRYFVRHQREGLMVPADNAPALAAALRQLATDPALARSLGDNARARLLDGFTERHVAEAVVAAYMRLLNS